MRLQVDECVAHGVLAHCREEECFGTTVVDFSQWKRFSCIRQIHTWENHIPSLKQTHCADVTEEWILKEVGKLGVTQSSLA